MVCNIDEKFFQVNSHVFLTIGIPIKGEAAGETGKKILLAAGEFGA